MFSWQDISKFYTLSLVRLSVVLICLALFVFYNVSGVASWLILFSYAVLQFGLLVVKNKRVLLLSHYLDLLGFSLLLYLNGSAMNGAISVLYIPILSAAILCSRRQAWPVTLGAIGAYSSLIWSASFHSNHHMMAEHLQGMWITFVFSAIAMTWFMSAQRSRLISQSSEISKLKEQQMRDEQILAVATYAANTAHQLSTPLFTMGMLVDELKLLKQDKESQLIIEQLSGQLDQSQITVKNIAKQAKLNSPEYINANDFIHQVTQLWWNRRNEIQLKLDTKPSINDYQILTDLNLEMAIVNLLDNSADASLANASSQVEITAEIIKHNLIISIQDQGTGVDLAKMEALGLNAVSEKDYGMGIGLILANAAIERSQGEIVLINSRVGVLTQISLPVQKITKDVHSK